MGRVTSVPLWVAWSINMLSKKRTHRMMIAWWCTSQTTRWCLHDDASVKSQDDYCMMMRLSNHKMIIIIIAWRCVSRTHTMPDPEIPDSRFIVYASKRRFVPVCASLNRGFRGLVGTKDRSCLFEVLYKGVSTRFGRRMVENWTQPILCSDFQNLRLRWVNFARWLQTIVACDVTGFLGCSDLL